MAVNGEEPRRIPAWVWVGAVAIIMVLAWLVIEATSPEGAEETAIETGPIEADNRGPGAVATPPAVLRRAEPTDIDELLPLGPEDAGIRTEIDGVVVGRPTDEGFFVRLATNDVLFVISDAAVEQGDEVDGVFGVIRPMPQALGAERAERARLLAEQGADEWLLHRTLMLDTTERSSPPR